MVDGEGEDRTAEEGGLVGWSWGTWKLVLAYHFVSWWSLHGLSWRCGGTLVTPAGYILRRTALVSIFYGRSDCDHSTVSQAFDLEGGLYPFPWS